MEPLIGSNRLWLPGSCMDPNTLRKARGLKVRGINVSPSSRNSVMTIRFYFKESIVSLVAKLLY
jgi:hypothetical protein